MVIFKNFSPLNSMRENIVPILSTHASMNLPTWSTCSQKTYHRSLLLLGAIFKFCCHVHCFIATLTLTARSTGLPCQLIT
jgi:4-alpha-glucanotransferase